MPFRRREQPRRIAFEADEDYDAAFTVPAEHGGPSASPSAPGSGRAAPPEAERGDPVDVDEAGPEGDDDADRPTPQDPTRRRRRRLLVGAGAGALLLVLGGLTAVDTARARQAEDLLRTAPGGVVGLDQAPRELWTIEHEEAESVVVAGLLLVPGQEALVAYDLSSGQEKWRRDDLTSARCASDGRPTSASETQTITCLGWDSGSSAMSQPAIPASTVTILGLDGTTQIQRELDPARGYAAPLADGGLARAYRGGDDGVVVLVEDTGTGEVRWTQAIPQAAPESFLYLCDSIRVDGKIDQDRTSLYVSDLGGAIGVAGCEVDAELSRDGTLLGNDNSVSVRQTRDGRLVRTSGAPTADGVRADVLDPDGTVRWSTEGEIIESLATDGTGPPLLFARSGSGVVAFDETGKDLWTFPNYATQVLLVTQDLTVISSYPGVVAVDTTTGEKLWTWKDTSVGRTYGSTTVVAFAGRGVLTIAFDPLSFTKSRWVSIDVVDGRTRWADQLAIDPNDVFTFDGRLYSSIYNAASAFG